MPLNRPSPINAVRILTAGLDGKSLTRSQISLLRPWAVACAPHIFMWNHRLNEFSSRRNVGMCFVSHWYILACTGVSGFETRRRAQEGRVRGSADPLKFGAEIRSCIWRLCRSVVKVIGNDHLSNFQDEIIKLFLCCVWTSAFYHLHLGSFASYVALTIVTISRGGVKINVSHYMIKLDFWPWKWSLGALRREACAGVQLSVLERSRLPSDRAFSPRRLLAWRVCAKRHGHTLAKPDDRRQRVNYAFYSSETCSGADCMGHGGTCPHFYKWLGTGGTVNRRTAKRKLTKLCWPSRKRSPKRSIVLLEPTKWSGTTIKNFFSGALRRIGAPHFRDGLVPPLSNSFRSHWRHRTCILVTHIASELDMDLIHPWITLDWSRLDWVRIFRKPYGSDWVAWLWPLY